MLCLFVSHYLLEPSIASLSCTTYLFSNLPAASHGDCPCPLFRSSISRLRCSRQTISYSVHGYNYRLLGRCSWAMVLSIWSDLTTVCTFLKSLRPPLFNVSSVVIIVLSCAVLGVGVILYRHSYRLNYYLKGLLCITRSIQPSTSNLVLPSFGISRLPPSYLSLGPNNTIDNAFGIRELSKEYSSNNFKFLPATYSPITPPGLSYSSISISTMSPDSYIMDTPYACASPSISSQTKTATLPDEDRLPPNITVAIPRQTALDRMMQRSWKVGMGPRRSLGEPANTVVHPTYTPVARLKVSRWAPSIIVTQPSTKSLSVYQSSYAFMLATGPDEHPFFWDTIPLPRASPGRAPVPARMRGFDKENRVSNVIAGQGSMKKGFPLWGHLSVPARSLKRKTRSRGAVLGDATNSPKSQTVTLATNRRQMSRYADTCLSTHVP